MCCINVQVCVCACVYVYVHVYAYASLIPRLPEVINTRAERTCPLRPRANYLGWPGNEASMCMHA